MGNDVPEVGKVLQNSSTVKVHSSICWELTKVLDKINCILPAIELARPGCMAGIKELCSLNNTIEKAKLLLQNCAESSKLYLAITGEATVLRCERIKASLDQSLCQIQNMVPQMLAIQISDVVDYLRNAKFIINSTEAEAGKAMLELLRQTHSSEELEFEAFQIAASGLNITSLRALLIEKRSISKLLDKIQATDTKKERILSYFMYLLKKYGRKVMPDVNEHKENVSAQSMISNTSSEYNVSKSENIDEPTDHVKAKTDLPSADTPPEEFCCPISSRLMYDPVVIASGQSYERTFIEKWFNEGHDTCPKTQKRLENLSLIPNTCMKDLISHWCRKHGGEIHELCWPPNLTACCSWEPSHCNSISSLKNVSAALLYGNTGDGLLQNDHSNVSFISSDAGYCSDSTHVKDFDSSDVNHAQMFSWSDDYKKFQSFSNFNHDMFLRFFYRLSELPLELQGKAVEDVKTLLKDEEDTCYDMLSNGFVEALMKFLENAKDLSNVQAQEIGAQILLSFLSNSRFGIPPLSEGAFQLLTSFLDSEITSEALMILQKLSHHPNFKSYTESSGVPSSLIKILDSEDIELLGLAVRILYDLSSHSEVKSHISTSGCIPRLVPLLSDRRLAEFCIKIMRNLSDLEEAAWVIAETNGSIASIAELLETGSHLEQEHAVAILHSLCSHSFEYCQLVMKEGVIPSLVDISVNGSPKGKEISLQLLHLLREIRKSNGFDSLRSQSGSTLEPTEDFSDLSKKTQPTSKSSGFFARKMRFFSKPRSLALF